MKARHASRRRGSTLVLVLAMGMLLAALAVTTAVMTDTSRRDESLDRQDAALSYRCEAALELLRLELVGDWQTSGLTPALWLDTRVRASDGAAPGRTAARTWAALPEVRAWISDVAAPGNGNWVELVAATTPEVGTQGADHRRPQSVRTRLAWGNNPIFDLAMLSVTTNCMWCHVRIKGDVGAIARFDPSHDSNNGSSIDGDIYSSADSYQTSAVTIGTPTPMQAGKLVLSGEVKLSYTGPKLPQDTIGNDGVPDFPAVDVEQAELQAAGSGGTAWAGPTTTTGTPADPNNPGVWRVPLGGTYQTDLEPLSQSTMTPVVDGNLILIGTPDNPINLDGDIFAKGDVIIRGPYTGKGAIYAGRNLYIVGDVYLHDSAKPAQWPLPGDDAARQSLANETNAGELRLAARSNVIMGDWTYRNDDGTMAPSRQRQGQEFINAEFGLDRRSGSGGTNNGGSSFRRYFEAGHPGTDGAVVSNELKKVGSDFVNDKGEVVPPSRVVEFDSGTPLATKANNDNASQSVVRNDLFPQMYDPIVAPGNIVRQSNAADNKAGTFQPWMSQTEFRQVLGTERYENMVWRTEPLNSAARQEKELGAYWKDTWSTSIDGHQLSSSNRGRYVHEDSSHSTHNLSNATGNSNVFKTYAGDDRDAVYVKNRGWGVNVIEQGMTTWPREVRRVDAFVYASKRIAGRSTFGMTINGGLAAEHVGYLAPGIKHARDNWMNKSNMQRPGLTSTQFNSRFDPVLTKYDTNWKNAHGDDIREAYINYDYRLRNGGYGYNLVDGAAGDATYYVREGRRVDAP